MDINYAKHLRDVLKEINSLSSEIMQDKTIPTSVRIKAGKIANTTSKKEWELYKKIRTHLVGEMLRS